MSSTKTVPKGLEWIDCEHGIGGKNSSICYIPEQDPVQEAHEKTKKTTYFKLTLPHTGNELKVTIWVSRSPKQFLLHVLTAIHACKWKGLDADFNEAKVALESAILDLDIAKLEYS